MSAVSRALAGLGALLIALGVFIPYATFGEGDGGVSVLDLDQLDTTIGFALEPLAVACASVVSLTLTRISPRLIAMLLATMGAQTTLMYVGYALFAATTDSSSPGAGAFAGLGGALLVFVAGVLGLRGRSSYAEPTLAAAESVAPSGWYPDPTGDARERFWDGEAWREETR